MEKEYNSKMKISAIKADVRERLMKELNLFLKEKFNHYGKVSNNTYGVVVGSYRDEDGFLNDVCCEISIKAKPFYEKENAARKIDIYNLDDEIESYNL